MHDGAALNEIVPPWVGRLPTVNNSYLAMNTYVQDYQGNYNGRRWPARLVATAAEERLVGQSCRSAERQR
jgi:hypothetical protein